MPASYTAEKKKKKGFEPYAESWRVRSGGEGLLDLYSNISWMFMRPMQLHRSHIQKSPLLGLMLHYYCFYREENGNPL